MPLWRGVRGPTQGPWKIWGYWHAIWGILVYLSITSMRNITCQIERKKDRKNTFGKNNGGYLHWSPPPPPIKLLEGIYCTCIEPFFWKHTHLMTIHHKQHTITTMHGDPERRKYKQTLNEFRGQPACNLNQANILHEQNVFIQRIILNPAKSSRYMCTSAVVLSLYYSVNKNLVFPGITFHCSGLLHEWTEFSQSHVHVLLGICWSSHTLWIESREWLKLTWGAS